jgi:Tfp pilus assembly protein PilE
MKNQKGFSFPEFLTAVVLVFALATIGYSQYVTSAENAKQTAIIANMHIVQLCAEDFSTQAEGVYPGGINTEVAQVCPTNPTNHSVMAGATKQPFPATALIPSNFVNPVNSGYDAIKNGPAKKPFGCVYYSAYDAAGNKVKDGQAALSYKITAMGAYRPLAYVCSSGGKEAGNGKQ